MVRENVDISVAILEYLKDAEYHTITATTLSVGKHFHLTSHEMNEIYDSRKSNVKDHPFSSTKIYTQTVLVVSHLRKAKFLRDFPGRKKIGVFVITDKGLDLFKKNRSEIKKIINSELNKYSKTRKSAKN